MSSRDEFADSDFTPRAKHVLNFAKKESEKLGHKYIGTVHLLLGILALGEGVAISVLKSFGVTLKDIREELIVGFTFEDEVVTPTSTPYSMAYYDVLRQAKDEALNMNYNFIGTEHILLAILREKESAASRILFTSVLGIDINVVKEKILQSLDSNYLPDIDDDLSELDDIFGKEYEQSFSLTSFGRDLTEMAQKSQLDPVIGRDEEIERLIQILCRRTKNNPVLIGEAGVGKTAIIEGLAQRIAKGVVPEILLDKKVFSLDLTLMVAGTKYRGQFEERIKNVIDEVRNSGQIILFIDELHTIIGAGGAEGAMDAANIIKPALSRGELQCIGATTIDEYRKGIEKDAALERRFQSIMVNPSSIEDTFEILRGLKETYEQHHKIKFTDEALMAAVKLSERYITGRFLPDKAIDVIDEAGARTRIRQVVQPPNLKALEKELDEVNKKKGSAISEQKFEDAANYRDLERELKAKKAAIMADWRDKNKGNQKTVDVKDITEIVAKLTGVPIQQMEEAEQERLLRMEQELSSCVIGQNEAISSVSRALRRSRADLKDPKRPIGSFVFLGPTGVGKTLLAKELAAFIFGNEDAVIQIDMSEYMEKFSVSRLIGSPPGYVGFGEGGELTEKVRRRPYSVVLFDEIEKAHPDVMHILLQILEEGKLTDSLGRSIDFRNAIIIMTSNIGADKATNGSTLGFNNSDSKGNPNKIKDKIMELAKKRFKPEFLNRIDDIIVFSALDKASLREIITLELKNVKERMQYHKLELIVNDDVLDYLIEKGYKPQYGARPLRRAIERYIEDKLAEGILRGLYKGAEKVTASLDKGDIVFVPEYEKKIVKKKRTTRKSKVVRSTKKKS
jgi:ATP-dependent Clp protease ATP-binding subunit ClpC